MLQYTRRRTFVLVIYDSFYQTKQDFANKMEFFAGQKTYWSVKGDPETLVTLGSL